jgi:glycosyltransferase involved in cell wall biosynthesis
MRILWLSNTQTIVSIKSIGCSWIGSLETELSKISDIQLGISFNSDQPGILPFSVGKTIYYPICKKPIKSRYHRLFYQWSHHIENESNIQQYLDVIRQFNPDLIHLFGTESDFGTIISKTTIPCIIHLQGNLTVISHKWFSGFTFIDTLRYSKKWLLLKGHGLFHDYFTLRKASCRENKIYMVCKYFMGRTDWDKRVTSVFSPDSKYFHCDEIMRSGFYIHQWQPHTATTNYIIITTIRRNIYKGLETILECKRIFAQKLKDYNIVWKIAGINRDDEITYMVERKYKVELKDYDIKLLGPLNEDELLIEMLKSDLYVHPSHIENSPNSVCEAMLLGMPVIATYAGGTPSILSDKTEGLLVQDGDPYALAGAIIELYKDREHAIGLGANARVKSLIRNDPKTIVNNVQNIYSSILSES